MGVFQRKKKRCFILNYLAHDTRDSNLAIKSRTVLARDRSDVGVRGGIRPDEIEAARELPVSDCRPFLDALHQTRRPLTYHPDTSGHHHPPTPPRCRRRRLTA